MRTSVLLFVVSALGVVVGTLVIVGLVYFSPWFVWSLLPEDSSIAIAMATRQQGFSSVADALAPYLPADALGELLPAASHIAYGRSEEGRVLVILPRLGAQRLLRGHLSATGWHTQRLGLIVRAWDADQPRTSVLQALQRSLTHTVLPRLTLYPLLIARADAGSFPTLTTDTNIIGVWRNSHLLVGVTFGQRDFPSHLSASAPIQQPIDVGQLAVGGPGQIVGALTPATRTQWNGWLADALAFEHTRPDVLGYLRNQRWIVLSVDSDHIAVGARAPDGFAGSVRAWVAEEDRYNRLTRRAFRLPDGTIGYEEVPGEHRDVFGTQPDAQGCVTTAQRTKQLWMCSNEQLAVVATDRPLALRQLQAQQAGWFVDIYEPYVSSLAIPNLFSITARAQGNQALVTFDFRSE